MRLFFPTASELYARCRAAYRGSCKCEDRQDGPCLSAPGQVKKTSVHYTPDPSALEQKIVRLYREADACTGRKAARLRRAARDLQATLRAGS